MVTQVTKALAAVAIDATHITGMAERSNKLAEFRGMLQALARQGDNATLLEIAELIASSPAVGAADDWWQP